MRPSASLPSTKRQNLLRDLEDNCFAVSQERSFKEYKRVVCIVVRRKKPLVSATRTCTLCASSIRHVDGRQSRADKSTASGDPLRRPVAETDNAAAHNDRHLGQSMQSAYLRSRNRVVLLQLVVLVHDRDGFLFVPFRYNHWTSKFVFYLAAMFAAICQTALAMGVLSLNLRPATPENWRRRSCLSGLALFLIDMMALEYMQYAVDSIFIRHACSFACRLRLRWPCV